MRRPPWAGCRGPICVTQDLYRMYQHQRAHDPRFATNMAQTAYTRLFISMSPSHSSEVATSHTPMARSTMPKEIARIRQADFVKEQLAQYVRTQPTFRHRLVHACDREPGS